MFRTGFLSIIRCLVLHTQQQVCVSVVCCFRDEREDVKDVARSGRPSTARTDENVESVLRLLTEDRRTTLQMTADRLNIGKETAGL